MPQNQAFRCGVFRANIIKFSGMKKLRFSYLFLMKIGGSIFIDNFSYAFNVDKITVKLCKLIGIIS